MSIERCELTREFHILISTPSLVSLRLDCHLPMAPVLVSMTYLKRLLLELPIGMHTLGNGVITLGIVVLRIVTIVKVW